MRRPLELKDLFPQVKKSFRVSKLVFDSREATQNSVFFALKGSKQDGHNYLEQAVQAGAGALVIMESSRVPVGFQGEVIEVKDSRDALAEASEIYYGLPTKDLKLIGVTGTNGKTTSVYMLEEILRNLNVQTGVMGTIDHHLGDQVWKSQLTTPDVVGLYQRLDEFRTLGATHVAMEISSHALDQKRVHGLLLDVALWTNLTRDHLDYHGSEKEYFKAKEKMFTAHLKENGFALINGDAENLRRVQVRAGVQVYKFGQQGDFAFSVLNQSLEGVKFHFSTPFGHTDIWLSTPGLHNVYNAAGALAAVLCLGHSLKEVKDSLEHFSGAPGRLELVHKEPYVFVDYAHTPDALASSLRTLKSLAGAHQKIIAVFGFGGDRDPGKRPLMVDEALRIADHIILTSDNPRSEDPQKILNDGLTEKSAPFLGKKIEIEVNRKKGIHLALQMARSDDVILVAGKGHEDYQIIGQQTLPFSDRGVIKEYFT